MSRAVLSASPPVIVAKASALLPPSVPTVTSGYGYPSLASARQAEQDAAKATGVLPPGARGPARPIEAVNELVRVYAYAGRTSAGALTRDAWAGDRALSFAVSVALMDLISLTCGQCCQISSEVCSNIYLSLSFDCPVSDIDLCRGIHARGTIVEAALYRLWKQRGMEPVIEIARALVAQSPRFRELAGWPKTVAPVQAKSDGGVVFVPTTMRKVEPSSPPVTPTKPSLPSFHHHIVDSSGTLVGYRAITGEQVFYGDDYHQRADGKDALKARHWQCAPGMRVESESFCPPVSPTGVPVLEAQAFHRDIPRTGYTFRRAALGEAWIRA